MLSAVAARKAALAAQSNQVDPTSSGSGGDPAITLPPIPPRQETPKRKPASQKSRPESKKPRKLKPFEKSNGRHSGVVDLFKDQADVIVVESDSEDSAMSILDDSDRGLLARNVEEPSPKRAWSPSRPADDSSDEDLAQDNVVAVDISELLPHLSLPQQEMSDDGCVLSSFEPKIDNNLFILTEDECDILGLPAKTNLVALSNNDSLCFIGTCALAVLHGSIDMYSTTLSASPTFYPVYAPRSAPLPIVRPALESASALNLDSLPARLRNIQQFNAVIALKELRTDVEGLGLVCRTFQGVFEPSRWQKSSTDTPFDIPGLYLVRQQTKECYAYTIPPSWSSALDRISGHRDNSSFCGSYLVKGPKNSGKSTFARSLTNRLLKSYRRVAFLECDLGQSEFTPGGMVSLNIISEPIFGPPFTHPTLPNYAHYIGSTTPRSSPSHYLDAVLAIIQTYRLDVQTIETDDDDEPRISGHIPIVVNTMGWSKGLGGDLTQRIESMLEPTDIYDIQAPARDEYAPAFQRNTYGAYHDQSTMDSSTARVHLLEPIPPSSAASGYTPADHRNLSILSYFHARFPLDAVPGQLEQITAKSWDVSRPLCAIPPYQVDCTVAFDKVILTGSGSEDVVEEEIGRVLNIAVVGFVSYEPGTIDFEAKEAEVGIPYTHQQASPPPTSSNCVGLALIRGVSPPSQGRTYLHILTPLPHALLARSRVLVKGEMELPVWGMLDFRNFEGKDVDVGGVAGVERDNVPFLQWGKGPEGVLGAEKRRVRRNLMRRGQM